MEALGPGPDGRYNFPQIMHEFFVSYLSLLTERHEDMAQVIDGLAPEALAWSPGAGMNSLQILVVHTAGAERYWI